MADVSTDMQRINEDLISHPQAALVRLYLKIAGDRDLLRRTQPRILEDDEFKSRRKALRGELNAFLAHLAARPPVLNEDEACASLAALDGALFDCLANRSEPERLRVDAEEYWLIPRPFRRVDRTHHEQQADSVRRFIRHFHVAPVEWRKANLPPVRIEVVSGDDGLNRALDGCANSRVIGIYVSSLEDGVRPSWKKDRMFADALSATITRKQSIETALAAAKTAGVHIVVFPELAVPPNLCDTISGWLDSNTHPFLLIAAGSFHRQTGRGRQNVTTLLGRTGSPLLTHEKIRRFTDKASGLAEDIEPGDTVRIMTTSLGVFAMPICLDFSDEADGFRDLWQDIGVDSHEIVIYALGTFARAGLQ